MKLFRKIICILLALVMAFPLALPAFAQTEESTDYCASYSFHMTLFETVKYTFTAPEKGIYAFRSDVYYAGYGITLNIGGELDVLTGPDEPSVEGNNYFSLDKNETVEIMAHRGTWPLSLQPVISFSVDVEYIGNKTIGLGETKISGKSNFYTFVPEKDGYYTFKSEENKSMATNIDFVTGDPWIWDGMYRLYGDNGDYYEFRTMLTAGEKYVIFAACGDDSDETKTCTVNISFEPDMKVDTVSLYSYDDGETILLDTIFGLEELLSYSPHTKKYCSGVTVSVENEKIAEAEIDEDGYLIITTHKKGETMLTLTTVTGNQVSYKIKVVSYISHVFSVFLDGISEILTFLRPLYDFLYT